MTKMANWTAALCGLAMALTGATAHAAGIAHSEVRLLPGAFAGEAWTAGVQIDLAEGWKTYWRMPGESGIAPHFDWSASRNVADVELRWPAPARFEDASGETIGYAHRVIFPVTVRAADPSRPVELALRLDYAVCKDVCIPARVDLGQTLAQSPAKSSLGAALIRQFDERVPRAHASGLALERARLDENGGAPRLVVELSGTAADSSTDIFVEDFDDAYFHAARPADADPDGDGESGIFHLPIADLADPALLRGRTLRLTVVTASAQLVGDVTVE